MKPDDLIGAWACSACHDEIDRRTYILDNKDARLYHLEGVIRTQAILLKEGRLRHENIPNKIAVASFKQPILATLKRIHYISDWGKRYRREVIEIIQQQQLDLKSHPASESPFSQHLPITANATRQSTKGRFDALTSAGFWLDDGQIDDMRIKRCQAVKGGMLVLVVTETCGRLPMITELLEAA